jgi:hypothetical protein
MKEDKNIRDRVASLLSIKSLVTLLLTLVFVYLSVVRVITGEQFIVIFTTIIAFYFGTQAIKE